MNRPPEPSRDELTLGVVKALGLSAAGHPAGLLAESALWLALANLGPAVGDELRRLLDGTWWHDRLASPAEEAPSTPPLLRAAVGLILIEAAGEVETGAAERAAAALACVALGCADAAAALAIQRELGRLSLLDIVEQIPLAARIRTLTQEFRHLPLPAPHTFLARIEDLFERLDREHLLARRLADRPHNDAAATLQALVGSRDPRLVSLARVVVGGAAFETREALLAACRLDDEALWSERRAALELESAYGELRQRLSGTPWALRSRASGYGLVAGKETP